MLNALRFVIQLIQELGVKATMREITDQMNELFDNVKGNSDQMVANVDRALCAFTADLHGAVFYFKIFIIMLSVYYVRSGMLR